MDTFFYSHQIADLFKGRIQNYIIRVQRLNNLYKVNYQKRHKARDSDKYILMKSSYNK